MIKVIGGSGFIGTRLCERLRRAAIPFKIVDKAQSRAFPELTVIADVRSLAALDAAINDGDVIINLAAEHRDDVTPKSLYDDVNVEGARNICAIANKKNIKTIVFTSSVAVYGFAPIGTNETGRIAPFNDYGRTKFEAEGVFRAWQAESVEERSLSIIRPTVVFGEKNRGNVYNLLKQIASGRFVMIGAGDNRKSIAYVENVAAFVQHCLSLPQGVHLSNYIDKPDFSMNHLVTHVNTLLGRGSNVGLRLPFAVGFGLAKCVDLVAWITRRKFPISSIRVKKFCSNSVYESRISEMGFVPPVDLETALSNTVRYEFLESHEHEGVFYSE